MQTLFIIEYQAMNDGTASAIPPLGYQVHGYKQTLRHGQAK